MLRGHEGLTIREAAAEAGISHGHLSMLENDKVGIGLDVAWRLLDMYGGSLRLFAKMEGPGRLAPRDLAPRDTDSQP
jgi:transcriptional regulator with XRE-family HTH domain